MIDISTVTLLLEGVAESEAEDIRKCLTALYAVRAGEQPLDRDFGIDGDFLDKPLPTAQNMFALEVIKKTQLYEKRVEVEKVEYQFAEGRMIPQIYLKGSEAS